MSTTSGASKKIVREAPKIKPEDVDGKLIESEAMATGGITVAVFALYLRSMGWIISVVGIVLMLLNRLAEVGSNFWLSHWTDQLRPRYDENCTRRDDDNNNNNNNNNNGYVVNSTVASTIFSASASTMTMTTPTPTSADVTTPSLPYSSEFYLGIYALLGISAGLFMTIASFFRANGTQNASKKLHRDLAARIMACPMSFFDTVPLGRILNR